MIVGWLMRFWCIFLSSTIFFPFFSNNHWRSFTYWYRLIWHFLVFQYQYRSILKRPGLIGQTDGISPITQNQSNERIPLRAKQISAPAIREDEPMLDPKYLMRKPPDLPPHLNSAAENQDPSKQPNAESNPASRAAVTNGPKPFVVSSYFPSKTWGSLELWILYYL